MTTPRNDGLQISQCSNWLRQMGKPNPRTCRVCGLGPCTQLHSSEPRNDGLPELPYPLDKVLIQGGAGIDDHHYDAIPAGNYYTESDMRAYGEACRRDASVLIGLLVAGGFVTEEKVEEARALVLGVNRG